LIYPAYAGFLEQVNSSYYEEFRVIVLLFWVVKPWFGYLSDCYYPFYYRVKCYLVVMCALSVAAAFISYSKIPTSDDATMSDVDVGWVETLSVVIGFSTAFIDSVCRNDLIT